MKACEHVEDSVSSNKDASIVENLLLPRIRKALAHCKGTLVLTFSSGYKVMIGNGQPCADVHIKRNRAFIKLFMGGINGWSEAYIDDDWSSSDLSALVEWALSNEKQLKSLSKAQYLIRSLHTLYHKRRDNNRKGSRKNISAHYDLGNDFYKLWLDKTMTYSSALFSSKEQSLEQAQSNKYQRILELLKHQKGQSILEIGCGWGGFAHEAAKTFESQVHGITLSSEQLKWGQHLAKEQGLDELISLELRDYRDLQGQYDSIVSIEMFEAVGENHWDSYFSQLKKRLKPGGRAVLQIITIDNERFKQYRKSADFIQRYVFPGGMLPSIEALESKFCKHQFKLVHKQLFGKDYAETLRLWTKLFQENWHNIENQGFDERFKRLWNYYLAYCEGGFEQGSIDVGFYVLEHDN
ncbi:class I SAM-dependent methyltransferase [Agaribacterium sp. ZY112]|uniref:class I SAM-dependent methyltransferase n=1 Tax=Agaribacterium sp. ZY112 TaxID=3233574 RepID=UPI00352321A6